MSFPLYSGDEVTVDGTTYEVLEEGELPGGHGATYRLRRRRDPDAYWERLRAATQPPPRVTGTQLVPVPEPLPDVLTWTSTRLDQEDADAIGP